MRELIKEFEYFKEELPLWESDDRYLTLSAGNIVLYYREEYGEWRLKDMERMSINDIVNVNPFSEHDILVVKRNASRYFSE